MEETAVNGNVVELFERPRTYAGFASATVWVSDGDIIPQSYQDELIFWRDVIKKGQFRIGDIAREIVDVNASRGLYVKHERVFGAIGRFCGCSARTVRYYYETASFYPTVVREQYDMLPFTHFVFARSCGKLWRDVLETAKSDPSMTEEKLRAKFLGVQSEEECAPDGIPVCDFRLNSVPAGAGNLPAGRSLENNENFLLRQLADKAGYLAGEVDEIVDRVDTHGNHKLADALNAMRIAAETIKERLPEIVDAIRQME